MRSLIPLLAASLLVGSCSCNCDAQQTVPFNPNKKATGAESGAYRAGQVIDFPTGANRLHLTVVIDPKTYRQDQNQYKVASWFTGGAPAKDGSWRSANARLRAIQEAVAFHYVDRNDPNFAETARAEMMGTEAPQLWLTGPDGRIRRDGGAGCHLDPAMLSNLSNPDEVADLIIRAAEGFNERPKMQGLIPRAFEGAMAAPCGPECNPAVNPSPNSGGGTLPAKIPPLAPRTGWEAQLKIVGYVLMGFAVFLFLLLIMASFAALAGSLYQRLRSA